MFNLRGIHKIFQNNIFVSRTFQRIHWQLSLYKCRLYGLFEIGKHSVVYAVDRVGGGGIVGIRNHGYHFGKMLQSY